MIKKIKEFFRSVKNKKLNIGRNQGAAWAVAYIAKYENISLAERMAILDPNFIKIQEKIIVGEVVKDGIEKDKKQILYNRPLSYLQHQINK